MAPFYAIKVAASSSARIILLNFRGNRTLTIYPGRIFFASSQLNQKWTNRNFQQVRQYTNLGQKWDRTGGRPSSWFGKTYKALLMVGFAVVTINWRYFKEIFPWLPLAYHADEIAYEQGYVEDLVYEWGIENVPKSISSQYNLVKRVEAAERTANPEMRMLGADKSGAGDAAVPAGSGSDEKKGGFRDRKITEYENRIRAYSTPDKVFRLFATLKIHDQDGDGYGIYMTPDEFIRAITPGMRQPEGLGLDHFKTFDPTKDKLDETTLPKDSIFFKLGEKGLINFSDYLFLMTVLAISARHIEIAFKIFDVNGDGTVDAEEFEEILNVLRQQTSVGMRHREAKMMGSSYQGQSSVNSGLKTFFFGKNGQGKLKVQAFLAFQAKMKDEVLQMEFLRMDPEEGKISERAFAKMLLTYAGISEQKQKRMLKRVKERFQGDSSKGVDFAQVQSFSQVFRHLNDIDTALGLYHVTGGSIDQATLQRVVKTVAHADLDDHIVDVVFTLFDDNEDGRLSQREFISIMKARQMRGLERPKDMGVTRLLSAIWKCAKEEVQGSRGG